MIRPKRYLGSNRIAGAILMFFTLSIIATLPVNAAGKSPSTAPVISLVARGENTLKIYYTNGRAKGASSYQYSLDAGSTWNDAIVNGDAVTVKAVPLSSRTKIALRGVNKFGYGPASKVYKDTRVIFLGASITFGIKVAGKSWARTTASTLGWQYTNFAKSGTGYMNPASNITGCSASINFANQASCARDWQPDVVVISGGSNDCVDSRSKVALLQKQILSTFKYTKSIFPSAEIIVTPVITPAGNPCLKSVNKSIMESAGSADVKYVSGADQWIPLGKSKYSSDGLHPNVIGHNLIASRFVDWYLKQQS